MDGTSCSCGELLVEGFDEVPLERDVREDPVEPARQPPGLVAEQRDHRGRDDQAHEEHVDQDREAEAEAHHLAHHVGLGDEGEEHGGHDQAGEQDHLADPRHAVDHGVTRTVALVVGLVHAREQEDVVVHAQAEQDREQHDRDERDDRHVRVRADQARADAHLEDRDDHAVGGEHRQQVEERPRRAGSRASGRP